MNEIVREDIESIIASECVDWSRFKNKTVFITGASGMLPSYMALTLLTLSRERNLNIKLVALVRNKKKAQLVFEDFLTDPNLEFVIQDVSSPVKYDGHIDFIIHAASQASPKYYGTDPVGTARANVIGTDNILRLAAEKGVESVLYFSTGGIYGNFPSEDIELTEDIVGIVNPNNIRSSYFESKRMGENLCVDYCFQYGVPVKIIRIFHTLGPGVDLNDGRAFSDFCKSVIEGQDIILRSDGSAKRTFCYITDAIRGYFIVLLYGQSGEAYNVGSSEQEITMLALAELICELYKDRGITVRFDIDEKDMTYSKMKNPVNRIIPSTKKLQQLGWHESVNIQECFRRTILSKITK